MKVLGYPLTWATYCFLDEACGTRVFGHTNGVGDFVMFDELGPPWPVHECYTNRITRRRLTESSEDESKASAIDDILRRLRARQIVDEIPTAEIDDALIEKYERELPLRPPDIEPVTAIDYLSKGDFKVVGYVQDLIENAVAAQFKKLSERLGNANMLAQQLVRKLDKRKTQMTVIDGQRRSFTFFADTTQLAVAKGDVVALTLRVEQPPFPQRSGRHHDIRLLFPFFLCIDIQRMPRLKRKRP
jgi:hypothetical protein